jgi:hypothetical protein
MNYRRWASIETCRHPIRWITRLRLSPYCNARNLAQGLGQTPSGRPRYRRLHAICRRCHQPKSPNRVVFPGRQFRSPQQNEVPPFSAVANNVTGKATEEPRRPEIADPVVGESTCREKSTRRKKGYPTWRYHWKKPAVVVNNDAEKAALGGGWADTPAAFKPYLDARLPSEVRDPVKHVTDWLKAGQFPVDHRLIKAALWRADATFPRAPAASSAAAAEAMRLAFDEIAR